MTENMSKDDARRQIKSSLIRALKKYGLELTQCGSKTSTLADTKKKLNTELGYWEDSADATNKPVRWLVHFDLITNPPSARVPSDDAGEQLQGARKIAYANTAQGKTGMLTIRIIPVFKVAQRRFIFHDNWEWLLFFGFYPALAV